MKVVILLASLCLLAFPAVVLSQQDELPPEWTFDDDDDIKNWGGINQLKPLVIDDVKDKNGNPKSVLRTESTGGDPFVFPDGNWQGFIPDITPFDGGKYDRIYIGVRANVSSQWQVYYITEQDGAYSERQRDNFQVAATDDFQDLEFEMKTGGWQEEVITGFRLDPGTIAGVIAEIDYLSFRGIPEGSGQAVEYAGKLAAVWGAIKKM